MRIHDPTRLYDGRMSPGVDRVSRMISVATHAPFLSAVMFTLLNITEGDVPDMVLWTGITLLTATFLPLVIVQHYSVRFGNTDGDVVRREDRVLPLIGGILSYILGVALLVVADAPRITTVMMVSYAISTTLVLLISTRWKISIHTTGVMGPSMALSLAYWPWGLVMFLLLPPVMWSRYVRRKHTPLQLVGGAVYGFAITWLVLWAFL